jgi:predicted NBD/HSP70 family sugar kinase
MRQSNERLVLQTLRLNGALSQARIAKLTHITPQTISLILGRLDKDELLVRHPSVRGQVGQPSVPISLNSEGAFAIGIQIGRRNMDVLLVDFVGAVRERLSLAYSFPDPSKLFDDINTSVSKLVAALQPALRSRLCGIGISAPLSLGGWQQLLGMAPKVARQWQGIDLRERVAGLSACRHLPIDFVKDTAAACVAELVNGRGRHTSSFLYMFVDTFIGGGLVLNSHLVGGRTGNAGAIGSIALALGEGRKSLPAQLLNVASLFSLEAAYSKAGLDVSAWTDDRALSKPWAPLTRRWVKESSQAIALAINSAACLLDMDGVVIDGACGRSLLESLLEGIELAARQYSWEGVERPTILRGTIGTDARALGAALLPIYAQFAPDRDLFLFSKDGHSANAGAV